MFLLHGTQNLTVHAQMSNTVTQSSIERWWINQFKCYLLMISLIAVFCLQLHDHVLQQTFCKYIPAVALPAVLTEITNNLLLLSRWTRIWLHNWTGEHWIFNLRSECQGDYLQPGNTTAIFLCVTCMHFLRLNNVG